MWKRLSAIITVKEIEVSEVAEEPARTARVAVTPVNHIPRKAVPTSKPQPADRARITASAVLPAVPNVNGSFPIAPSCGGDCGNGYHSCTQVQNLPSVASTLSASNSYPPAMERIPAPAMASSATLAARPVPTAGARSIRQYDITSASSWTRVFKVKGKLTRTVVYTLNFTAFREWSMLLSSGGPKDQDAKIVGAAKFSLWRTITQVVLGDPTSKTDPVQGVELKLNSKWKHNHYVVSLPLPPAAGNGDSKSQVLRCSGGGMKQRESFINKINAACGIHHKLFEAGSNRLSAR